jgi:GH25 family lysozyme M1 (1,4-beta-N-acetylmuramidase)
MGTSVLGIDVASWQGKPDWAKVAAAGYKFVYIKASDGGSSAYASANSQFNGATAAGLATGLYHFADPTRSPAANADAFATQIGRLGAGQLPPCLDLETGSGDLSGWTRTFIAELRARTGIRRVMVYSGVAFFTGHIGESWMDPDILLWLAHYGVPAGKPGYTSPRVAIHQYAATGSIPGIAGNCDVDYAIWPLARILTGGDTELTQEEHDALMLVRTWITTKVPAWGGGTTYPANTNNPEMLAPLEFLLRSNVETRQAFNAAVKAQALSDADVNRIAQAVVGLLRPSS